LLAREKLDDQSERRSLFAQLPHDIGERHENILAASPCGHNKLGCDSTEPLHSIRNIDWLVH
jgi:hypothetical protein